MSSDLKTQFVNYMTVLRFSYHTKRSYVTGVKLLSKYYMQSPDTLNNYVNWMTFPTIFLIKIINEQLLSVNTNMNALRFISAFQLQVQW